MKIAKIINTHGIRGDLKLKLLTDFVDDRFSKGHHVFIRYEGRDIDMVVRSHRNHKGFELVRFEDHLDINLVEKYKGSFIYDYKDEELLDEDEYFISDLIGCDVFDHDKFIGKVKEIQLLPHHDILVVEGDKERLQAYEGAVIAKRNGGIRETFTVRRISYGVGVEKTFLVHSPMVEKVEERIETREVVEKEEMTEAPAEEVVDTATEETTTEVKE